MDPNELVTVYTVSNNIEAEIVKNALNSEGIKCFVEGGNQAGEAGLVGIPIRLECPASDADRARKFLEQHRGRRVPQPHPHHKPS